VDRFLENWLPGGKFPVDVDGHLELTDNQVWSAILEAAKSSDRPGHVHADRIVGRKHFRVLYSRNPEDFKVSLDPAADIHQATVDEFGTDDVRLDQYKQKGGPPDFPVYCRDERVRSSLTLSSTLGNIPVAAIDYVFVCPDKKKRALAWLKDKKPHILESTA
jgi:hypothetical protein